MENLLRPKIPLQRCLAVDCGLTSRRNQRPLAVAVPPSRVTSLVGRGSAFIVRLLASVPPIYESIEIIAADFDSALPAFDGRLPEPVTSLESEVLRVRFPLHALYELRFAATPRAA